MRDAVKSDDTKKTDKDLFKIGPLVVALKDNLLFVPAEAGEQFADA